MIFTHIQITKSLFYSKDPYKLLKRINLKYFEDKEYKDDFKHIHFIHQENLVPELKSFLIEQGFRKSKTDRIDQLKRINENKYPENSKHFRDMFDEKLIEKVLI